MFLNSFRKIGAAFYRRVVGNHHRFETSNSADAGDNSGAGSLAIVHFPGGQRRQLQKGTFGIQNGLYSFVYQQLASLPLTINASFRPFESGLLLAFR
jgi:hypothetical protein